ncbi:hypothetical protein ACR6HW_11850 [Fusibacter sp. JL298sf-3]
MKKILIVECKNDKNFNYYVKENHEMRMLMDYLILKGYSTKQIVMGLESYSEDDLSMQLADIDNIIYSVNESNIHSTQRFIKIIKGLCPQLLWFIRKKSYERTKSQIKMLDYPIIVGSDFNLITERLKNARFDEKLVIGESSVIVARKKETLSSTYLNSIVLNGGLCEIVNSRICTEKCPDCERLLNSIDSNSNPELYNEIEIVSKYAKTRKISIVDLNILSNGNRFSSIVDMLNMSSEKYNVTFSINCCYRNLLDNYCVLKNMLTSLHNIELYIDFNDPKSYEVLNKVKDLDVRIKLHFIMANESTNQIRLYKQLDYLIASNFVFNQDLLFKSEGIIDEKVHCILEVWRFLYTEFIIPEVVKLIDLENQMKLPFREGIDRRYDLLPKIDNNIKYISKELNCYTYNLMKSSAILSKQSGYDVRNTIIELLKTNKEVLVKLSKVIKESDIVGIDRYSR